MKKNNTGTFSLKRLWILILLPISILILTSARISPSFTGFYTESIYPFMSGTISFLFSLTSVSVAQIILIILTALLLFYLVATVIFLIISGNRLQRLAAFAVNIAGIVSAVVFLFAVTCGINYYRPSFAETEGIVVEDSTEEELSRLVSDLALRLNETRAAFDGYLPFKENAALAEKYVEKLSEEYPSLSGTYGAPKPVSFFGLMSYSQITGFFFPFTYEANVNETIPNMSLPVTMCHELAHLRGHMREDEANYIAYLACVKSENPEFIYSGLLLAYSYASSALYGENNEQYKTIYATLSDDVKADLREKSEYWAQYEGFIADVSDAVNDTYLKLNDQQDGTKSYGRMVDLLLAEWRANAETTE